MCASVHANTNTHNKKLLVDRTLIDPDRNMNEKEGLDIAGTEH